MKMLRFYLAHAVRDMSRNRRLTLFALFAVAVGVAAVVGLRTLSLMITDTLISNAQAVNRGDIVLSRSRGPSGMGAMLGIQGENMEGNTISSQDVQRVYDWAAENSVDVTKALTNNIVQVAKIRDGGRPGPPQIIQPLFVEPEYYPFYDTIYAQEPEGAALADLIQDPNDIVLGENLAGRLDAKVGDQIRAGTAEKLFTVRGIVPSTAQGGFSNFLGLLLGFAFFDYDSADQFGATTNPNEMYLRLPEGASVDNMDHAIRSRTNLYSITTTELMEMFEIATAALERVVLVLSLAALFIGGIGIINTMLVLVSRRTLEIAVLKTVGLKGRQITLLFLAEAFILGLLGSVLGIALGMLMTVWMQSVGETIVARPLTWRFSLDPWAVGAVMGITVTTVFGFLPTLAASQIRPAVVLRPTDLPIPRAGKLRTVFALLVMVVILGIMVGQIVNAGPVLTHNGPAALIGKPPFVINVLLGSISTLVALILLGIIVALLWVLVWLLGRLPSFGSVDLKLAIRALRGHRTRNASTMLALIIGIASLSVITLVLGTISKILNTQLTEAVGGNVVAMSFTDLSAGGVQNVLDRTEGVQGYIQYNFNSRSHLEAINGIEINQFLENSNLPQGEQWQGRNRLNSLWGVEIGGEPLYPPLIAGQHLDESHAGKPVVILPGTPEVLAMGLEPGDTLTYYAHGTESSFTLTVIGIVEGANEEEMEMRLLGNVAYAPNDALPSGGSSSPISFKMTLANVEEDRVNEVLADLGGVLGTLVFDIGLIDSLVSRLLQQMVALPLLASILSLSAGAVIIANTVALATLERHREIGIMKALGLKGRRVLGLLLIENGIIGLVSGLIGVGLGAVPAYFIGHEMTGGAIAFTLPLQDVFLLLAMSMGIAIAATLVTAIGASRRKPLNVLRYE